ncbi:membrane-associated protein, putative, partial [Bodo saltans]
ALNSTVAPSKKKTSPKRQYFASRLAEQEEMSFDDDDEDGDNNKQFDDCDEFDSPLTLMQQQKQLNQRAGRSTTQQRKRGESIHKPQQYKPTISSEGTYFRRGEGEPRQSTGVGNNTNLSRGPQRGGGGRYREDWEGGGGFGGSGVPSSSASQDDMYLDPSYQPPQKPSRMIYEELRRVHDEVDEELPQSPANALNSTVAPSTSSLETTPPAPKGLPPPPPPPQSGGAVSAVSGLPPPPAGLPPPPPNMVWHHHPGDCLRLPLVCHHHHHRLGARLRRLLLGCHLGRDRHRPHRRLWAKQAALHLSGPHMKTFFWKKFPKPIGIWGVKEDPIVKTIVDEEFLLALFEVKKNAGGATSAAKLRQDTASKNTSSGKTSTVFMGQRLQNIAITLKKLRLTKEVVSTALMRCDAATLNEELLSLLLNILATPEDVSKLNAEKARGDVQWSETETFLHYVATTVPDARERVQLWQSALEFKELVDRCTKSVCVVEGAVEVVTAKSGRLAVVLRLIREVGNLMNRGTNHGDAVALRLESLGSMGVTKAIDGRTSLMEALVLLITGAQQPQAQQTPSSTQGAPPLLASSSVSSLLMEERSASDTFSGSASPGRAAFHQNHQQLVAFSKDLVIVTEAIGHPFPIMTQSLSQLNHTLQRMRKIVSAHGGHQRPLAHEGIEDALPAMLSETCNAFTSSVAQLTLRHQRLREDIATMIQTFGEDPNSTEETVVWKHLAQFGRDFDAALDATKRGKKTKDGMMLKLTAKRCGGTKADDEEQA